MESSPLAGKSVYIKVGPWTVDEDRQLIDYIQSHARSSWKDVPQAAGLLRSYQSCSIRWSHLTRPNLCEDIVAKLLWIKEAEQPKFVTMMMKHKMMLHKMKEMQLVSNKTTQMLDSPIASQFHLHPKMTCIVKTMVQVEDSLIYGPDQDLRDAQILNNDDETQNERDATCIEQNDTNVGQPYSITIPPTPQDDLHSENKDVVQVDSSENNDTAPNDSDYDDDDQNNNKTSLDTTHISKTPGYITSKICFSLEVLEQHFDMNMEDAAKSLNVSRSSLKRMCRANGINRWPCRKRKINHQQLDNPKTVNKLVQKNNNQMNQSTRTQAEIISPSGNASSTNSNVIIKATYGADIIKFRLSVSSGVDELREKIGKRLELEVRSFKLKYRDDAGDLVLITCDEDLHDCLGNSRLSTSIDNKTTFDILVINNSG